jgi:selenium metabolism protein YedF
MKKLDLKGLRSPRPLIMLKEALLGLSDGEEIRVEIDNNTSLLNLVTYLRDQGEEPAVSSAGKVHTLVTRKPQKDLTATDAAIYCTSDLPTNYVVCIQSERMGKGDPELGRILMETFVSNLKMQEQLPSHVILYNGGVKLAMKQSPVCAALNELEELGIRIMLSGTCVDHYGLHMELGVGMISNMVAITETLASAGHVITP